MLDTPDSRKGLGGVARVSGDMKRTRLKPGKPLKRSKPMPRGTVRLKRTAFRQGRPVITNEWSQVKRFVEGRANGYCEAETPGCPPGRHRGHQVHHRHRRSQGGSDDPANLVFVCALGHSWIHDHPAQSYERGWLVKVSA